MYYITGLQIHELRRVSKGTDNLRFGFALGEVPGPIVRDIPPHLGSELVRESPMYRLLLNRPPEAEGPKSMPLEGIIGSYLALDPDLARSLSDLRAQ